MFLTVLVVIIVSALFVILILSLKDKTKSGWVQFFATGKDCGFSFREIELLHKLAVKSKLENPSSLFASQTQLDNCIRSLVKTMRISGTENDKGNQDFLSKLYDYRKKIEMEKPKIKNGISNSRQITEGQNLRILVEGTGVFKSQVVKTANNYLTISRPTSAKLPGTFSWQSQKLSVYFWREEDAGYVFDTEVSDEVFSKGIASQDCPFRFTLQNPKKKINKAEDAQSRLSLPGNQRGRTEQNRNQSRFKMLFKRSFGYWLRYHCWGKGLDRHKDKSPVCPEEFPHLYERYSPFHGI
jgi:hypothetical protein